ncbi:MAG: hypothetical protein RML72_06910 [Bacteroidia bacterium]|nr:hypothetical protein [Bacteroidia bacterium]MDW8158590.1 hypothetical protein [Bacteroidia bacterium]
MSKFIPFIVAIILLLNGCGKSEEQKQKEEALDKEVNALHEEVMKLQPGEKAQALKQYKNQLDSLIKKYPKDSTTLLAEFKKIADAEQKLNAAKTNMDNWMSSEGAKKPDPNMNHEQVIKLYEEQKSALTNMRSETQAAITEADSAVAAFKRAVQNLTAKKK